jgi:hypothetical protein
MGTVVETTGEDADIRGKVFVVFFDTYESKTNKRFYVIVSMKFRPGEESWSTGKWSVFRERFPLLNHADTCVGITGNVINNKFYRNDPTDDTYYIWINYPEEVVELENCPKQ